jgi:hypothetical protein
MYYDNTIQALVEIGLGNLLFDNEAEFLIEECGFTDDHEVFTALIPLEERARTIYDQVKDNVIGQKTDTQLAIQLESTCTMHLETSDGYDDEDMYLTCCIPSIQRTLDVFESYLKLNNKRSPINI